MVFSGGRFYGYSPVDLEGGKYAQVLMTFQLDF